MSLKSNRMWDMMGEGGGAASQLVVQSYSASKDKGLYSGYAPT